jgi:hypothetical protein
MTTLHQRMTLRRMAAWLAFEAGLAWERVNPGMPIEWQGQEPEHLSRIALRAIDAAQPGQHLWRRAWAWWFYAGIKAPSLTVNHKEPA